jgi:solute carrier family 25 (mitochondrial citrate transporter), member 1
MPESIFHSLIAGIVAGAVEPYAVNSLMEYETDQKQRLITYPTEFVKTRTQFQTESGVKQGPIEIIKLTLREKGIWGLYSGCGALVIGNSLKAGVRFFTYDTFKSYLADSQVLTLLTDPECNLPLFEGKVSAGRSLLAGLGTGMVESIVAVTPSEAIK